MAMPGSNLLKWIKQFSSVEKLKMGNIFHSDFRDFIQALNNNNVKYLLVGGYAVIFYGHSRTTGDMDIWVDCALENYQLLVKAFHEFRMPVFDMTEERFLQTKNLMFFGLAENRLLFI
jgi:hypothetical protein